MLQTLWNRRTFIHTGLMGGMASLWLGGGFGEKSYYAKKNVMLSGGFWPVMMTPYREDLSIDFNGLKRLIRWYEDAGARGLFANCGSSEMYQLSPKERLELTQFVVNNSNLPVVTTGTFYDNDKANIEFISEIYKTGVKAVVLIPSVLVKKEESEKVLMQHFTNILDQTRDIPLGIYECPGPYHRLIQPEMLDQLQKTGRFLYFKDTSANAKLVDQKIQIASQSDLGIYNAHSPHALHSIRHGGAGISCIAGNFYPELFSYLWKHGRTKSVSGHVKKVNDFIVANDPVIGKKYPVAAKYFMNLRGLHVTTNSRKNTSPLDRADKERLDELWEKLNLLSKEVDINLVSYL